MTQLNPIGASAGWCQVGPKREPYGCGLDHSSGRTEMSVRPAAPFGSADATCAVRVWYLDRGHQSWALRHRGEAVMTVKLHGTGHWLMGEANITMAGAGNDLLTLFSRGAADAVLSVIELLLQ